jgi:hypothetical protein
MAGTLSDEELRVVQDLVAHVVLAGKGANDSDGSATLRQSHDHLPQHAAAAPPGLCGQRLSEAAAQDAELQQLMAVERVSTNMYGRQPA